MSFKNKARRWITSSLWKSLETTGAYRALRPWYAGPGAIVALHRVLKTRELNPNASLRDLELSTEELETLINFFLEANYKFVSPDEIAGQLTHPTKHRFVCMTFDDGYREHAGAVLSLFRQYQLPFTVYVTTGHCTGELKIWSKALARLADRTGEIQFKANGREYSYPTQTAAERSTAVGSTSFTLFQLEPAERTRVLESLGITETELSIDSRDTVLRWEDLDALLSYPKFTLGAHSVLHFPSAKLSAEHARREMAESKRELEVRAKREVRHYAYPFGSQDACGTREFELARQLGFQTAVTTQTGTLFAEHRNRLQALPRLSVGGNDFSRGTLDKLISGLTRAKRRDFKRAA
jgi:peptidoglycan/xylan/chitin deacetylase (PgdA/CDA1 family)